MDYQSLFKDTDMQDGGDNFRCLYYRQGGDTQLVCRSTFPMLFVLQGSVEMHFRYDQCILEAGNLSVIETKTLSQYRVAPDTIVLIYRPPLRLEMIFRQCSVVYGAPYSEPVPILPPLAVWIDQLLDEHMQGKVWVGEEAHEQRRALAQIMMLDYPPRLLGELYAAYSACVLGDCEKCRQELVGSATANIY